MPSGDPFCPRHGHNLCTCFGYCSDAYGYIPNSYDSYVGGLYMHCYGCARHLSYCVCQKFLAPVEEKMKEETTASKLRKIASSSYDKEIDLSTKEVIQLALTMANAAAYKGLFQTHISHNKLEIPAIAIGVEKALKAEGFTVKITHEEYGNIDISTAHYLRISW